VAGTGYPRTIGACRDSC